MDEIEELLPVILSTEGVEKLMFYRKYTDELIVLKNSNLHNRLQMFGTFRKMHLTDSDICSQGLLKTKLENGWKVKWVHGNSALFNIIN